MPHLVVEYSENLSSFDCQPLLRQMNQALMQTGLFSNADDIKARARRGNSVVIGLDNHQQAYVYADLAILTGRSAAQRQLLSETLLAVLSHFKGFAANDGLTLQLCVEVREIERSSYAKVLRQL
jgi:5-carboxymethyl-2-hydroxymuconate isomerase